MPSLLDDIDFTMLLGPAAQPEPDADPFGRIGAGDPAWEQAREAWMGGASLERLFGDRLFQLNDAVGANKANQRGDVFKVQSLLHREGHLDAEATGGPTGYWGIRDDTAMKALQKEGGLTVDGWAGPGGETMNHFQTIYLPQQEQPDLEEGRRYQAETARDLACQLGLDPDQIDMENPAVLPALGAVRFIRYGNGHERQKSLQKVQDLKASDPKLAGRLHALATEIVSQPQWHYDKMTPEELRQRQIRLDEAAHYIDDKERRIRPYLPKYIKRMDRWLFRPMSDALIRDERQRLQDELDRRRDPRDR
ncbi:MAG: peptidoglycan-binding domain-containing protein [Ferrovibrio sp.]|uniref:peptidoglycan-binding domain-containing protein n=1 Tax=Ferrovibrio sp. TaxID=1917215 RepID=UPI0039188431